MLLERREALKSTWRLPPSDLCWLKPIKWITGFAG